MKKIYISGDMEGIAGSVRWDEVDPNKAEYFQFQKIWTDEANLICNLLEPNFDEIVYKDGHWFETNVLMFDFNDILCSAFRRWKQKNSKDIRKRCFVSK